VVRTVAPATASAPRICPDCARPLTADACPCGWAVGSRDGVPELLSSRDRRSPLFGDYLATYDRIAEEDLRESIQARDDLRRKTAALVRDLGELPPGTRVCDVGVGQGHLLDELRTRPGVRLTAVDVATPYLRRELGRADGADALVANAENLPFREAFDLIVSTDVIEHVLNVGDYLVSVHRALVPAGRFVVRAPYREDLLQYARLRGCPYEMVHLRTFDRPLMADALRGAGFAVERVQLDGWFPGRARGWVRRTTPGLYGVDLAGKTLLRRHYALPAPAALVARALVRPTEITVFARRV
jgi:SAM-dependent methyltransferase